VIAAKLTSRSMCNTNAITCAAPMLAVALAGGTPLRCRYRILSAAPPTAAGVTSVMNEAAICATRVRVNLSRSSTNPVMEVAAAA
jgi:hypothetical protein